MPITTERIIKYPNLKMPKTAGANERVPWTSDQFKWRRDIFDRKIHELRGAHSSEARQELLTLRSIIRRQQRALERQKRRGGDMNGS